MVATAPGPAADRCHDGPVQRPPRDWDERYAGEGYAFGTEPNDFLVSVEPRLPRGRALSLAEGEGRNATWLAGRGFEVWSVDGSSVGVEKTHRLAAERGVTVHAEVGDLADVAIAPGAWDVILSVFVHLPRPLRERVLRAAAAGLAPGGAFVLEAYAPDQIGRGTGGPPDAALLAPLDELLGHLAGLEVLHAEALEREVVEGPLHSGLASVVQLMVRRPA